MGVLSDIVVTSFERGAGSFAFHLFVTCVLSVVVCLFFLLVSLVGCIL